MSFIGTVGQLGFSVLYMLSEIGRFIRFVGKSLIAMIGAPFYLHNFLIQIFRLGYLSIPIVVLASVFIGSVLVMQSYFSFSSSFYTESSIANVVVTTVTRELIPVLISIIVSGRICSYMAAEIGSMRITDQIDALQTLSFDPIRCLVVPRMFACIVSLPVLVFIGNVFAIYGGYLTAVYKIDFNANMYIANTVKFLELTDIAFGVGKALLFGLVISSIGCYYGYRTQNGGSYEVGVSVTKSVVSASIVILFLNYLFISILA